MSERHPGRLPKLGPYLKCKVSDCQNDVKGGAFGLCHPHYIQSRKGIIDHDGNQLRGLKRIFSYGPGAKCLVEGCGNRPKASGLCHGHWQRQQSGQEIITLLAAPRGQLPSQVICCVEYCSARANSRGMCAKHASVRGQGLIDAQGNKLRDKLKPGRQFKEGPRFDGAGYHLVPAPVGYARRTRDGRVLAHRLAMEQQLGRPLEDWELVHHKDGDKSHNSIENLQLMNGRAGKEEGHPPGHEVTLSEVQIYAEHLKLSDPGAYEKLIEQLKDSG